MRQESSDWLVWCSSCHHGGHYAHITQWFASHDECPVNGCCCHCSELCACLFHSLFFPFTAVTITSSHCRY